jgi:hypothetical protein
VGATLALIYLLLAGYLPAYYIEKNYIDGEVFVSLYSHLFRYGQFFGWITVLFLIDPVFHLWNKEKKDNKTFLIFVLVGFLGLSAVVVVFDLQSTSVAPYEIKPEILQSDNSLRDHFTKKERSPEDKQLYETKTLELLKDRANWSFARYLHYTAIFLHAFSLLFILSIVVWLIIYGGSEEIRQTPEYKRSLVYCTYTILISALWLLMRLTFNYQRQFYFAGTSNPAADYLFVTIFVIGSLVIAILLSITFIKDFNPAITIIGFIFTCFGVFLGLWDPEKLLVIFGKDARIINYYTISFGILLLSLIVVLVRKLSSSNQRDLRAGAKKKRTEAE